MVLGTAAARGGWGVTKQPVKPSVALDTSILHQLDARVPQGLAQTESIALLREQSGRGLFFRFTLICFIAAMACCVNGDYSTTAPPDS